MNIYIDFDRTIFDCDHFLVDFYSLIEKYKIPRDVFRDCQNQCKKKGFNPYTILDKVNNICTFNSELYSDIDNLLRNTSSYLYSDAKPFLKYLRENNYHIIILTKGNLEYQKKKIINANIDEYYDDIIVTMCHKGNIAINYCNSIFLDDNPVEIQSILRKNPKMVIRIRRNKTKYYDDMLEDNIKTITSLDEIINSNML